MPESPYHPSLLTTAVGGVQWGYSAVLIYGSVVGLYVEYVLATRTFEGGTTSIGPGRLPFYLCAAAGVLAGGLWVTHRTTSRRQAVWETRRRVEFLVLLHVWPLLLLALALLLPTAPIERSVPYRFLAAAMLPLGGIPLAAYLVYWRGVDWVTNWRDYLQPDA